MLAGDGNIYNRADPKSSFKWGTSIGALLGAGAEVGFLFGRQLSTLKVSGTSSVDVGDLNVYTYQGYFAYNFGDDDDPVRPYVMVGLGATHFGSVDYVLRNGQGGTIRGVTRFSNTVGGGVKLYPTPRVGVRLGVHWTPTYVNANGVGFWCDLFWGCYVPRQFPDREPARYQRRHRVQVLSAAPPTPLGGTIGAGVLAGIGGPASSDLA